MSLPESITDEGGDTHGNAKLIVPPTRRNLARAGRLIREGKLIVFPTETVYGLGGNALSDHAVAAIFEAKGRPRFNPLIVHFHDVGSAAAAAVFDQRARLLAETFWPGALTLILPRGPACPVSLLASAGLDTLAVRVPAHETARTFLAEAGRPIAAPSANPSGAVSPTAATHVAASLNRAVSLILDGGACPIGIESTVIDLTPAQPVLLRPGGITVEDLESVIGPLASSAAEAESGADATRPISPGRLGAHYATKLPLRLNVRDAQAGEALLSFGPHGLSGFAAERNLSPSGELREAAANLFAMLRALDQPRFKRIAVMPVPETGLGLAINDRLRRAASSRRN